MQNNKIIQIMPCTQPLLAVYTAPDAQERIGELHDVFALALMDDGCVCGICDDGDVCDTASNFDRLYPATAAGVETLLLDYGILRLRE